MIQPVSPGDLVTYMNGLEPDCVGLVVEVRDGRTTLWWQIQGRWNFFMSYSNAGTAFWSCVTNLSSSNA